MKGPKVRRLHANCMLLHAYCLPNPNPKLGRMKGPKVS
jgi:hypothetical protein